MTIDVVHLSTSTTAAPAAIGQSTTANTGHSSMQGSVAIVTAKQAEDALFGYLQSIRALGRTKVNFSEAARALGLSIDMVVAAAHALKDKGVEVA
jgi:hypothetical protein